MNMPERISKYNIARVLGKGSMGVVYEGFDPDIQRKVAIKTLTPNIADQSLVQEFHNRFKIEAQASARCMHPNIVTILEYGDLDGMPFMVMEYINGRPLDDLLALSAPIRFNRVIKIFSQLLKGLHFAHQNGVVHRDIKPSNIMVTEEDGVKITDFGIARLPVSSEVTQLGYTVGTPHYMAPEQEASSNVDGRADLFALSVVLIELLAKIPLSSAIPHACLSPAGIYITPKVNMTQMIPEVFLPVLQRGLALRPENRFESAQTYAVALKSAVTALQGKTGHQSVEQNNKLQGQETSVASAGVEFRRQLREMEVMLSHHVGPIAASLIELNRNRVANLYELAESVADEIPGFEERKRFLQAWESDELLTIIPKVDTARVQTTIKPVQANDWSNKTAVMSATESVAGLQLSRRELSQIEEIFSEYVGPMAQLLLQDYVASAQSFDDLIAALMEAIPNQQEKTDFRIKIKKMAV